MNPRPKPEPRPPTEAEKRAAVRCLVVGTLIGAVMVWAGGLLLDDQAKLTYVWHYGRVAFVALLALTGYSIGLGRGRAVGENLECLAIAVVMALILKHFLVEAYKIPTGSMQPTIIGNEEQGIFDRVLVNKFAYLVDEPERYDVVVFKYPLDRSKNYIKRLVGLPGEHVAIRGGNVFTSTRDADGAYGPFTIARKPRGVRESVLRTLYPAGDGEPSFAASFEVLRGRHESGDGVERFAPGSAFRYGHGDSIRDKYLDGYDPDWGITRPAHVPASGTANVTDFGLAMDVTPRADGDGAAEVRIVVFAAQMEHRAILGVDGGGARLESGQPGASGDVLVPLAGNSAVVAQRDDVFLRRGETTRVRFLHVDEQLILEVDGDEVLSYAYDDFAAVESENALEVEFRGCSAEVEALCVQRDLHYTTEGSRDRRVFEVPEDGLFVLGDNSQNSADGRRWEAQAVRFPNGTERIREKHGESPAIGAITDVYGETYRLPPAATFHEIEGERFSFVPRELLLGKALAVFWPIYPHFRWKLIR